MMYDMVNPTFHFLSHQIWKIWQFNSIINQLVQVGGNPEPTKWVKKVLEEF